MKKIIAACLIVVVVILILNIGSISRLGTPYAGNGAAAIEYNTPYTVPYNNVPAYTVAPTYVPVTPVVTYAYPQNYRAAASNYRYTNLPSRATNSRYSSGGTAGYTYNTTTNSYVVPADNSTSSTYYSSSTYPYNYPPYTSSNTYYSYQ